MFSIGKYPPQTTLLGPELVQQVQKRVGKEVARWSRRSTRQKKLYSSYTDDIDNYFTRKTPHYTPLYILSGFNKLVETDSDNDTVNKSRQSNRKFQKVGCFDPSQYEAGTGKYTFYLVKYGGGGGLPICL